MFNKSFQSLLNSTIIYSCLSYKSQNKIIDWRTGTCKMETLCRSTFTSEAWLCHSCVRRFLWHNRVEKQMIIYSKADRGGAHLKGKSTKFWNPVEADSMHWIPLSSAGFQDSVLSSVSKHQLYILWISACSTLGTSEKRILCEEIRTYFMLFI